MAAEQYIARQRLTRLLEDVRRDAEALDAQAARIRAVASGPDASLPDHARAAVLAVSLHAYFGAAESLATRVARTFDGGVPEGHDWHRQLLDWMSAPLGEERPAVFSDESHPLLLRLLAFRHFFRADEQGGCGPRESPASRRLSRGRENAAASHRRSRDILHRASMDPCRHRAPEHRLRGPTRQASTPTLGSPSPAIANAPAALTPPAGRPPGREPREPLRGPRAR